MPNKNNDEVKVGLPNILAIGIGAALGGNYFGWQFVVIDGFIPAVVALIFSTIFYILYTGAITELAYRYKTSGGTFDFCFKALGDKAAMMMAFFEVSKLLLSNSGYALCIAAYFTQLGMDVKYQFLSWIVVYAIITIFDSIGVRQSKTLQIVATTYCTLILVIYICSCLSRFSLENLESGGYVKGGTIEFLQALPFALQFYLGFEEIPLLMTYAKDPDTTIPRGVKIACCVMVMIANSILVAGAGVSDAMDLMLDPAPLMVGFNVVYGQGSEASLFFGISIIIALLNNFFAFAVYSSQQIQAVAQAGYLPRLLAYRHPVHQVPVVSSISFSIAGLALTSLFEVTFGLTVAQNVIVTAALVPAVFGYIILLECIVRLRHLERDLENKTVTASLETLRQLGSDPGKLRWTPGVVGARVGQFICILFYVGLLILATGDSAILPKEDFMWGHVVVGVLGFFNYIVMTCFRKLYISAVISKERDVEEQINVEGGDTIQCDGTKIDLAESIETFSSSSYLCIDGEEPIDETNVVVAHIELPPRC